MAVRYAGYTVLELLIVVLIIVMLAAFSANSMMEMGSRSRLVSVANGVSRAYKIGRNEALKHKQPVTLQMEGEEWQATMGDTKVYGYTQNVGGINISPELPTLTIRPTGESTPAEITISDTHPNTQDRCIRVFASGQVTVSKGSC